MYVEVVDAQVGSEEESELSSSPHERLKTMNL